jgi:hypothetical protein
MLIETAEKFSEDNNIVKSKEWANHIPENGLDGYPKGVKREYIEKGPHTQERIENIKKSLHTVHDDGLTPIQRSEISRQSTTENGTRIFKNGLTYNEYYARAAADTRKSYQHEINNKVSETKRNNLITSSNNV